MFEEKIVSQNLNYQYYKKKTHVNHRFSCEKDGKNFQRGLVRILRKSKKKSVQ